MFDYEYDKQEELKQQLDSVRSAISELRDYIDVLADVKDTFNNANRVANEFGVDVSQSLVLSPFNDLIENLLGEEAELQEQLEEVEQTIYINQRKETRDLIAYLGN